MNSLDIDAIRQRVRLARKSKTLFSRIKAALTKPWQWDTEPLCNDAKYNEGYADGMQAKRRRNPEFNKEISR